jgi:hypothetical protein
MSLYDLQSLEREKKCDCGRKELSTSDECGRQLRGDDSTMLNVGTYI